MPKSGHDHDVFFCFLCLSLLAVANSVRDYEDLLADSFANYVSLSEKIGSVVQEQAALVKKALATQRDFIELASRSQKPADSQFGELLKPTADLISQIQVRLMH